MPLGLNSFSFDLFGISRRQPVWPVRPVGDADGGAPDGVVPRVVRPAETGREDERSERDRREAEELSFWGLGFFPVM